MRLLVSVGVVLVAAAVLFGVGWRAGADRERVKHQDQAELIREAADAFDQVTARRISSLRANNQQTAGKVREAVNANQALRDCVLDDVTRGLLDAARAGAAISAAPGPGSLPAPGPPAAP